MAEYPQEHDSGCRCGSWEAGKRAEVREHGEIANTPAALTKLLAKLAGSDVELNVCYEAAHAGMVFSARWPAQAIPDPQSPWLPDQD